MSWRCLACGLRVDETLQGYRSAACAKCHTPLVLEREPDVAIAFTCPFCQATVDASASRCDHCARHFGVPRCSRCRARIEIGTDHCAQCNAPADLDARVSLGVLCPVCSIPLGERVLGRGVVLECSGCRGVFVSQPLLEQWLADRAADAPEEVLADARLVDDRAIRYRRCPRCAVWMNRTNFGPGSGIIIDSCARDGVWLDGGELHAALEFARAGKLDAARARRVRERAQRSDEARRASRPSVENDPLGLGTHRGGDPNNWLMALLRGFFGN